MSNQSSMPDSVPIREFIGADVIASRVADLADRISADYEKGLRPSPVLLCVLDGAFVFFADLIRKIRVPFDIAFVRSKSYTKMAQKDASIVFLTPLPFMGGRDVIIVEDIVDTGSTIAMLRKELTGLRPAAVRVCALLNKTSRRVTDVRVDYIGFDVPDLFVVGYGMDIDGRLRNLPFIGFLPT